MFLALGQSLCVHVHIRMLIMQISPSLCVVCTCMYATHANIPKFAARISPVGAIIKRTTMTIQKYPCHAYTGRRRRQGHTPAVAYRESPWIESLSLFVCSWFKDATHLHAHTRNEEIFLYYALPWYVMGLDQVPFLSLSLSLSLSRSPRLHL